MKICIASPIDTEAMEALGTAHEVTRAFGVEPVRLKELAETSEVLIFRSGVKIDEDFLADASRLRLVIRAGSGTDNIDLPWLEKKGIAFHRIPEPGARAVAEMSMALMLGLCRNLVEADRLTRQGRWAKHELMGWLLKDKVLGLVGVGLIGSEVARLGAAFGMTLLGCGQRPASEPRPDLEELGVRMCSLDDLLVESDVVSVHIPLNDATRGLFGPAKFEKMKPGAFLVNLARGGIVDEAALRDALTRKGGLAGAALDVHEREGEGQVSPLADLPNVILTPHIGAMTADSQREIGRRVVDIIQTFLPSGVTTSSDHKEKVH
ncbi:MAG: NAD(P)-dependent oxidoreductase [Verrucomicrobiota bacterium]